MSYSKQQIRRAARIDFRSSNVEMEWKNDELGQLLRWTLRPVVANAILADSVKTRLMQRVHVLEVRRAHSGGWRAWLRWARDWFNDYALSSEMIWPTPWHSLRAGQLARYQMFSAWMFQTTSFGHSLPML